MNPMPLVTSMRTVITPLKTEKTIKRGRPPKLSNEDKKVKRQAIQRAYRERKRA